MKLGTKVSFTRRNGQKATGRVAGTDQTDRGEWVAVNTAQPGKNPCITKKRPSQLKKI